MKVGKPRDWPWCNAAFNIYYWSWKRDPYKNTIGLPYNFKQISMILGHGILTPKTWYLKRWERISHAKSRYWNITLIDLFIWKIYPVKSLNYIKWLFECRSLINLSYVTCMSWHCYRICQFQTNARYIFIHLKLWVAVARHNFKWVKIYIFHI